jgi:undecaprenyl diphosphate synthase
VNQKSSLPRHVAVIMDGNGRWAAARGLPRSSGHQNGVEPVRMCIRESARRRIEALTLYAFSSENWQRPESEVSSLMGLFFDALANEVPELQRNQVRLSFIGERSRLATPLQQRMREAEASTAELTGLRLQVAVSYGGRRELVLAARRMALAVQRGELAAEDIDEAHFAGVLELAGLPEPDLFIRTGGEQRISNFLLWHLAYTELYFTPVLWPDFDVVAFEQALQFYAGRQRRFGLTGEQVDSP